MKRGLTFASTAVLALLAAPLAHAQMILDVAKISCRQLLFDRVLSTKTRPIGLWLSGYYNGKRNNLVVDLGAFEKNVDTVLDYCRLNQEAMVIDAIEKALGPSK